MAESVYRQDYLNERLQLWVDNLNLLYVAFTRAGKNLIVWSRKEPERHYVRTSLRRPAQVAKAEEGGWDEEGSIYESGAVYPSGRGAPSTAFGNGKDKGCGHSGREKTAL